MAGIPEIRIQLVAGGVSEVLSALKTVEQAVVQQEKNIQKIRQQGVDNHLKMLKQIQHQTKSSSESIFNSEKKLTSDLDTEFKKRTHMLTATMRQLGMNRLAQSTNVAAGFGFGGGAGGSMGATLAGGLAFLALGIVGSAVKKGFEILIDGIKFAANEFASAIVEIGGGIGVAGSIVRAAKNEANAAGIAARSMSVAGQGINKKEVLDIISDVSKNSQFTSEDWMKAASKWQEKTGKIREFTGIAPFLGDVATLTGMSLENATGVAARLKTQFPQLTQGQVQKIILKSIAQGHEGTIEFKDLQSAGKVTGAAGLMKGDIGTNIGNLMGVLQMTEPLAGSPDRAITQLAALNKDIEKLAGTPKSKGFAKKLGIVYEEGKLSNWNEVVQNMVMEYMKDAPGFRHKLGGRQESVRAIAALSQFATGDNEAERRKNLQEAMEKAQGANMSLEEFSNAVDVAKDSVDYQLKVAFNDIANTLGTNLLPVLQELAPALQVFADGLAANSSLIGAAIDVLVGVFEYLGEAANNLGKLLLQLIPDSILGESGRRLQKYIYMTPEERKNAAIEERAGRMADRFSNLSSAEQEKYLENLEDKQNKLGNKEPNMQDLINQRAYEIISGRGPDQENTDEMFEEESSIRQKNDNIINRFNRGTDLMMNIISTDPNVRDEHGVFPDQDKLGFFEDMKAKMVEAADALIKAANQQNEASASLKGAAGSGGAGPGIPPRPVTPIQNN